MINLPEHRHTGKRPDHASTHWRAVQVIDLRAVGTGPGVCDRCKRRGIRFLHTVINPEQDQLHVGSECALRLCHGYSPEREEGRLRNLWKRRSRWLTRNWGTSKNGNETMTFRHERKKVWVTVYMRFGAWRYSIGLATNNCEYSPLGYASSDEAKLGAFDTLAVMFDWAKTSEFEGGES